MINVPWVGPAPEKNKWCETNGWKREFAKLDKMEQLRRRGPLAFVSNEKLFWKSARQMADCYKSRPVLTNFVPCKVNFRPQKLEMSLRCLPEKVGNVECRRSALIADPGITKTSCCQFGLLLPTLVKSAQLQKNISSGLVISFTFQHCEGMKIVLRQGCKGREDRGNASPSSCLSGWSGTGAGLSEERGVLSL